MPDNIEIERKILIEMPDIHMLENEPGYNASFIEQIYICTDESGNYTGDRIRKRVYNDVTKYYRTHKEDITELSRVEIENEITADEYERLSKLRLPDSRVIRKVRHCFDFLNQLVEVDIYEFWDDKATVEIELECEEQEFVLPDYFKIIEDVTTDKSYSNYSLSCSVK